MKGDFTRSTFRARKHYASVRMQQGRVQVDADWNEQQDISAHLDRTAHLDIIGAAGVPIHAAGFGVTPTPDGRDLILSPGRMYVDGILCELEEGTPIPVTMDGGSPRKVTVPLWVVDERPFAPGQWVEISDADQPSLAPQVVRITLATSATPDGGTLEMAADVTIAATAPRLRRLVTYTTQPEDPEPAFTTSIEGGPRELTLDGGTYIVFLDVWERHMTALDDPHIREVALGGPDTCTRVQTVWQVRLLSVDTGEGEPAGGLCRGDFPEWEAATASGTGQLNARTAPPDKTGPCLVAPTAGYRRLENQLYRVEVHVSGTEADATFKWSRDNGTVVTDVEGFDGTVLTVGSIGLDDMLGFATGQWVELVSDATDLHAEPGTLYRVADVKEDLRQVILDAAPAEIAPDLNPKLRRWDQAGNASEVGNGIPLQPGSWQPLEDGVEVQFSPGSYRSGDYWLIPARTADGTIEWPPHDAPQAPGQFQPPQGILHHYARLAGLTDNDGELIVTDDCRVTFPPLTEIEAGGCCCTVTVGDGITSHGDHRDIQSALDAVSETGGRVCILPGQHTLEETAVIRARDVVVSGCGRQGVITIRSGQPAFRAENVNRVTLEGLTIAARAAEGAVVFRDASGVRVAECFIVNRGGRQIIDIRRDSAVGEAGSDGPAVMVSNGINVSVEDNHLVGLPAVSIQGRALEVRRNRMTGGVWVRDGSEAAEVTENGITRGGGPGVILGGIGPNEEPSGLRTGVDGVRVAGNVIRAMRGSGITTMAAAARRAAELGDVEDVTIAGNDIEGCALEGPDTAFDPVAVGGIVLRSASRVRIRDNRIAGNGQDAGIPACGIFTFFCNGLEIIGNTVVDNGTRQAKTPTRRCIEFGSLQDGPNPRTEDEVRFTVFNPDGAPDASTRILRQGNIAGLDMRFRTEITLPADANFVSMKIASFSSGVRIVVRDAGGQNLETGSAGGTSGQVDSVEFRREGIRSVFVDAPNNESVLVEFCWERAAAPGAGTANDAGAAGAASAEGGIVCLFAIGGDIERGGGGGTAPPTTLFRAAQPAAQIHDNVVVCPRGPALAVTAMGGISVSGNALTSQGIGDAMDIYNQLGRCVLIVNLGVAPGMADLAGLAGAFTFHREAAVNVAARRPSVPDGRTLFSDNQVTLQVAEEGRTLIGTVFVASRDDLSIQDNQFQVETVASLGAAVWAIASTLRASGNRWTEIPGRAAYSYFSTAGLNNASGNQSTHCILVDGASVVNTGNQEMMPGACKEYARLVPSLANVLRILIYGR